MVDPKQPRPLPRVILSILQGKQRSLQVNLPKHEQVSSPSNSSKKNSGILGFRHFNIKLDAFTETFRTFYIFRENSLFFPIRRREKVI